jgi:NitT/TauT family transport system permease protein
MATEIVPAAPASSAEPPKPSRTTAGEPAGGNGWRRVFRPNAFVPASTYRIILLAEAALLFGGWLLMPSIIPSPARVLAAFQELVTQQGLIGELWTSLTLNLEAIALSTVIALLISYGTVIAALRPLAGFVAKGRFLSLIGLTFLFTVFVGGGHPLKLALLTFGLTVFFVTAMADVVEQTPREKLDYARTLRMGEWHVLWEIIVLGNLGPAFDIMRQNAAMGWLMLTMVEGLVRSEGGIGRLLLDQEKHFSLAAILAVQLVFLLVGIGQDLFIRWLKTIFVPHAALAYRRDRA